MGIRRLWWLWDLTRTVSERVAIENSIKTGCATISGYIWTARDILDVLFFDNSIKNRQKYSNNWLLLIAVSDFFSILVWDFLWVIKLVSMILLWNKDDSDNLMKIIKEIINFRGVLVIWWIVKHLFIYSIMSIPNCIIYLKSISWCIWRGYCHERWHSQCIPVCAQTVFLLWNA